MDVIDTLFADMPADATLGDVVDRAIWRGERWGLEALIRETKRNRFPNDLWLLMLDTAARLHPDWFVCEDRQGLDRYRPHRRAIEKTRRDLVFWFARRDPASAIRIRDSWRMGPDA